MARKRKQHREQDHTAIAFLIAAVFGVGTFAAAEMVLSDDNVSWRTWHIYPVSLFAGTLMFAGLVYLLKRLDNTNRPAEYLLPYIPLFLLSCADLLLKVRPIWLLPIILACIAWGVAGTCRTHT